MDETAEPKKREGNWVSGPEHHWHEIELELGQPVPPGCKRCAKCGRVFRLGNFPRRRGRNAKQGDGRRDICNACNAVHVKVAPQFLDEERKRLNPMWLLEEQRRMYNISKKATDRQAVDSLKEQRAQLAAMASMYGVDLRDLGESAASFFDSSKFALLEAQFDELEEVSVELLKIPVDEDDERQVEAKKKFETLCEPIVRLLEACQEMGRLNPLAGMLYTDRSQETGEVLRLDSLHLEIAEMMMYPRQWAAKNGHPKPEAVRHALIIAPPGSGKTTMAMGLMRSKACIDPRRRTAIISENLDVARKRLGYIRDSMTDGKIRALYPWVKPDKDRPDNTTRFSLMRDRMTLGRAGLDGKVRKVVDHTFEAYGSTAGAQGSEYEDQLHDDPCPKEVSYEDSTRNTINNNFTNQWIPRARTFGHCTVICTRWHELDIAGTTLKMIAQGDPEWIVRVFAPTADIAKDGSISVRESHIPDRYPVDWLQVQADKNPSSFRMLFLGDPRGSDHQTVRWLSYYLPEDLEKTRADGGAPIRTISIDPADTDTMQASKFSAETGITCWECYPKLKKAFCTSQAHIKRNVEVVVDWIAAQSAVDASLNVLYDAHGQLGSRMGRLLREKIPGARVIGASRGPVKKEQALYTAAPYLEGGSFLFPGQLVNGKVVSVPEVQWLVDQLLHFGSCATVDGVDSVTQYVDHAAKWTVGEIKMPAASAEWVPPWEQARRKKFAQLTKKNRLTPYLEDKREIQWLTNMN